MRQMKLDIRIQFFNRQDDIDIMNNNNLGILDGRYNRHRSNNLQSMDLSVVDAVIILRWHP
jgi:hypothetical protein